MREVFCWPRPRSGRREKVKQKLNFVVVLCSEQEAAQGAQKLVQLYNTSPVSSAKAIRGVCRENSQTSAPVNAPCLVCHLSQTWRLQCTWLPALSPRFASHVLFLSDAIKICEKLGFLLRWPRCSEKASVFRLICFVIPSTAPSTRSLSDGQDALITTRSS